MIGLHVVIRLFKDLQEVEATLSFYWAMFDYRVSQNDRGNGTAGLGVRLTYM